MIRLCGGKPGQETIAIVRRSHGRSAPWSLSVTARSKASLRLARTSAKTAPNPARAATGARDLSVDVDPMAVSFPPEG